MTALAARTQRPGGPVAGHGPAGLTGTAALISLALRRDRIILPVWLYVFAGSIASTGYSFRHLYTRLPERLALIASVRGDASVLALSGPVFGDSAGSLVAWKVLVFAAGAAGLMGIFTVVRHTRDDEEQGRLELVGATAVGRQAPLAAALVVAFGSCLVLIPLIAAVQVILGYPVAGSLALGAAVGLSGCVFAAIAAVCAQLTVSARTARGMAIGVLGVAFLLRAVGDAASGTSWLRWASPLGWAEQMQVYASPRWMVGALFVVATAVVAGGAARLATRRDLGAGLLPVRPGRAEAAGWLRSPLALAWRLQRGALLGWAIGFVLAGAVLGSAASGIGAVLNTSPQARQIFIRLGGHSGLVDAYLAAVIGMLGVASAAYAVAAVLRLHGEETERRAEPVLATPVGRVRWAGSHLLVAAARQRGAAPGGWPGHGAGGRADLGRPGHPAAPAGRRGAGAGPGRLGDGGPGGGPVRPGAQDRGGGGVDRARPGRAHHPARPVDQAGPGRAGHLPVQPCAEAARGAGHGGAAGLAGGGGGGAGRGGAGCFPPSGSHVRGGVRAVGAGWPWPRLDPPGAAGAGVLSSVRRIGYACAHGTHAACAHGPDAA